jgi:acyl carrier protein
MRLISPEGRQKVILCFSAAVFFVGLATFSRVNRIAHETGKATTFDRVRGALVRRLNVAHAAVRPESRIDRDLRPEGLDRLELREVMQEEFGVQFWDGASSRWVVVQDLVTDVDRSIQQQGRRR